MSFPYQDLQPRTETNALRFVEDNPEYDGRNVSIGVLDTGIFPLAHGIAVEEGTGAPKLVHLIDCTGSGDVETVPAEALWVPSEKQDGGGRGSGSDDDNHCNGHWLVVSPVTGRNILLHKDWPIRPFPTSSEEEKSSIGQDSSESKSANDDRKDASGGEPSPSSAVAPNDDGSSPANTSPPTLESETKIAKATVPVRVGVKRAYELFPRSVRDRVKKERAKVMGRKLEPCVTALRSELARYAQSAPSLTPEQIKDRDNAKALLEVLTAVQTQLDDDPGPLYDVVVWYDGQDYCCVVNTADDGDDALVDSANSSGSIVSDSSTWDARSCEPLYSYSQRRQVLKCGAVDQMVMAVNLYDSGRLVSLVADVTPHGTHVAGIAAASEQGPRRSGVAPGAELVGLKIGDTRLGSMETGGALARAMREAVRLRCDVINLSYGEATSLPNAGYLIEMANELVYKHNIVFVSSVGNNGPALSTVGAPGGTTESILGVAAYVSPSMMRVDYSLPLGGDGVAATTDSGICSNDSDSGMVAENESKETVPSSVRVTDESEAHKGTTFTWSAVGPTVDGALGVDVTAPGGAITSVSHWCLQKSMLMNGTSMSSPHATGCVALLISACKGLGIPVSPSRIKRALMNTALALPKLSSVQQGAGMIQVDKALDYLVKFKDDPTEDINFAVSISDRLGEPRGVYLRQADETAKRHTYSIFVVRSGVCLA
jgi:tripeptidyl-peptidase-2